MSNNKVSGTLINKKIPKMMVPVPLITVQAPYPNRAQFQIPIEIQNNLRIILLKNDLKLKSNHLNNLCILEFV